MKDSGKAKILDFVKLLEHFQKHDFGCICGAEYSTSSSLQSHIRRNQIDPTTCCGMAKVWEAFLKMPMALERFTGFLIDPFADQIEAGAREITVVSRALIKLVTSPPDLAQALLEYIESRKEEE